MKTKKQNPIIKNSELIREMRRNPDAMHQYTNESLEAMNRALDIQSSDKVVSVCGSGAQPYSFLEHIGKKGKVVAIDYNQSQLLFAQNVLKLITQKDIGALAELDISPKDKEHFLSEDRLERIAANSKRVLFKVANVSQELSLEGKFTKGYFSNAKVNLPRVYFNFEKGALLYVVFEPAEFPRGVDSFINSITQTSPFVGTLYDIDVERTKTACAIEDSNKAFYQKLVGKTIICDWMPCIFVKK